MIEDEVRQMLERRAGDVSPSPGAWAEIEHRLDGAGDGAGEGRVVALRRETARRRFPLVAAAVLVALGVAAAIAAGPDGASRVDTTPAGPSPTAPPTTFGGEAPTPAIWPATTTRGLQSLQADAAAGRRPDLLDPRAAAGQYLSDLLQPPNGPVEGFEVQQFRAGDAQSGEVPYVMGGLPGTVLVRRLAGDGSIWYVTALTHLTLPVTRVGYDGTRFTAEIRPTAPGRLIATITPVGGGQGRNVDFESVVAGQAVGVDAALPGAGAAIALFRLIGPGGAPTTLAQVRSDEPAPIRAAYCEVLDSVMGERPESYVGSDEHLADLSRLRDAAPPEVVRDVAAYRAFVADRVSPGDPLTQDVQSWPQAVRDALQRIDAANARLCQGAP